MRIAAPDRSKVAILVYQGLLAFEYGVTHELLVRTRPQPDGNWYRCKTVSCEGMRLRGNAGITIAAEAPASYLAKAGTVIVPGWRDPSAKPPAPMLAALRNAHRRGARLVSICTGAFVLAHAGLLDGRRATTHWLHADRFKADFPQVMLDPDVLYVDLGDVITSAGNAAGMDALLHMIRTDFSGEVANIIARRVVMPPHREGGQAQYVLTPVKERPGLGVGDAMDWARGRLDRDIGVRELAGKAAMSVRSLNRKFLAAMAVTPGQWLLQERIARARSLLETSRLPLPDVAEQCGYHSLDSFRTAFKRGVGVPPGAYRRRFDARSRPRSASAGP